MSIVHRAALYLAAAALGWLGLLFIVATVVHGRAWVRARTLEEWRRLGPGRRRRRGVLVAPSRDRPLTFTFTRRWRQP